MRYFLIFYFLITSQLFSCQQGVSSAELDKPVPDYVFKDVVNSSDEITFEIGKPIILEFWTTWCRPCIPAMQKLDKLQSDFGDKIQIITVSPDKRTRLEKYLEGKELNLPIVYDTTHSSVFNYRVIPHSIIVDHDGIIRAITSPKNINDSIINRLLDKKEINLPIKDDFITDTNGVKILASKMSSDMMATITNYNPTRGTKSKTIQDPSSGEMMGIEFHNVTLLMIYQVLYNIPIERNWIFFDGLTKEDFAYEEKNLVNFSIEVSENFQDRLVPFNGKLVQESVKILSEQFPYIIKRGVDSTEVMELRQIQSILKPSTSEESEFHAEGPYYTAIRMPLHKLTDYIENMKDIPVIDKTGLEGEFDVELSWQFDKPEQLDSELLKYGLILQSANEQVHVLEIHRKK